MSKMSATVKLQLAVLVLVLALGVALGMGLRPTSGGYVPVSATRGATVGGVAVPSGLACQEDELVGYVGRRTLGCVHIEALPQGDVVPTVRVRPRLAG